MADVVPQLPFEINLDALLALSPEEQEEQLANLEELRRRMEGNPLWTVMPHRGELGWKEDHGIPVIGNESRGQQEFMELDRAGIYLGAAVAGNRFGKTTINVLRCLVQTLPWDLIPPWWAPYKTLDPHKGDVRFILAGKDSSSWLPRVLLPKLNGRRALVPVGALHRGEWRHAWNGKERSLTFADGSVWWINTYDQDTQAWAGSDVDGVCFDEEPLGQDGKDKYDEAIGRIIDRDGNIRFTLTPVEGIGWLHDELTDEHDEPRRDPEVHVVTGDIDHNPHISQAGKRKAIKRWEKDPTTLEARRKGLWVHKEGLIFPEFRRHIEQPPLSEELGGHMRRDRRLYLPGQPSPRDEHGHWKVPVFEAIDPGINDQHPFCFTVAFLNTRHTDPYGLDDMLEVFFGIKVANTIVAEQADMIREARLEFGYRPQFTVIDPAAKSRNPETGRKLQTAFRKEGINTVAGQNDRGLTYGELRGRLVAERIRIWWSLDWLFGDELTKYRWKRSSGRTEDVARPEPIKRNDDGIDTLRYMVVRIPVWRGGRGDDDDEESDDPRRRLAREALKQLRKGHGRRNRARVGGVW